MSALPIAIMQIRFRGMSFPSASEIRQYVIAMPYWARSAPATEFFKAADQALAAIEVPLCESTSG